MSNRANRFSFRGKEHGKAKRAIGKSIAERAFGSIKSGQKQNLPKKGEDVQSREMEQIFIKNASARIELIRRVDLIRSELIRQVLSPGGAVFSGSDLITYINLLVQQPLMVFIYKKEAGGFVYQKHFDVEKFGASRQSLRLAEGLKEVGVKENFDSILNKVIAIDVGEKCLFRVFGTKFYLRCFLLDTRSDDQPFYEVKRMYESPPGIRHYYVAECLSRLLNPAADDLRHYTDSFRGVLFGNIERALSTHEYISPGPNRSSKTRISDAGLLNSLRFDVGRFSDANEFGYGGDVLISERLDRSVEDAANSASILKRNDLRASYFDKSAGNMFLLLRAYTRSDRRGEYGDFKGVHFDVRFNFSKAQRSKISSFLLMLSRLGKTGYIHYKGGLNECYGGYANSKPHQWSYGREDDLEKGVAFRRFAISLDEWFWNYLKKVDSGASHLANQRIQRLIDFLISPVGRGGLSLVDPVFYYGASIYRMPFRRDGGLSPLVSLYQLYDELSEDERRIFSFKSICELRRKRLSADNRLKTSFGYLGEVRVDCIRVVLFFYLSRLWSIGGVSQEGLDTKVHFYPIEVGGVVVGAVGKTSFDLKPKTLRQEDFELPTLRRTWDEEVMFFTTVVSPLRSSLRTQYFNFQIDALTREFSIGLNSLLSKQEADGDIDFNTSVKELEARLNVISDVVSRFCPYPQMRFSILKAGDPSFSQQLRQTLDLGGVTLQIWQERSPSVFRALTRGSQDEQHDAVRMLMLRFWEVAQLHVS